MAINNGSTEDDFIPEKLNDFVLQNKLLLKQFSLIDSFNDTKAFLRSNPHIIQRQTLYFMISYGMKKYLKGVSFLYLTYVLRINICSFFIIERRFFKIRGSSLQAFYFYFIFLNQLK